MSEQLSAASFLSGCEAAMYVSAFRIGILIITFLSLAKQYKVLEDHSSGLKAGNGNAKFKIEFACCHLITRNFDLFWLSL